MAQEDVTVRLDARWAWLFAVLGAALGLGAALAVGPVVEWLLALIDTAPGPLRLASVLPFAWAAPILTVAGAIAGWFVYGTWSEEVSEVTVSSTEVRVTTGSTTVRLAREEVVEAFLDREELVVVDARGRELCRARSDTSVAHRLRDAFERFGYPWAGTSDPRDAEFVTWVDRSEDLDEQTHALLRRRRRALTDERTGTAEELRDELLDLDVVVRDRGDSQQYRLLP